jgi:hypothetical protein
MSRMLMEAIIIGHNQSVDIHPKMENKPVGKLNDQGCHSKRPIQLFAKKHANNQYGDYGQVAAVHRVHQFEPTSGLA